jgi:hypothetical protein
MKRLLLVLVMISLSSFAVEYGTFYRDTHNNDWNAEPIVLNDGDRFIVENILTRQNDTPSSNYNLTYYVALDILFNESSKRVNFRTFDSVNYTQYDENLRTLLGPASVTPHSDNGRIFYIAYKIIRASESSSSSSAEPINIVSLPADNNGDVDLLIETSPDLQTWTPIYSDSIGATGTATFIRTRLVTE